MKDKSHIKTSYVFNALKLKMLFLAIVLTSTTGIAQRQMENLDRGVLAVRRNSSSVLISWRIFASEFENVSYNVYRGDTKLNSTPITGSSNYLDSTTATDTYSVAAIIDGVEQELSSPVDLWANRYKKTPITAPPGGTTPDGTAYTYSANDASIGDLDGDGEYDIVLKWMPSNSSDNIPKQTGLTILQGIKMDGTILWTINLGINIRSGPHYTQFMVYDLDGDGKAEVACKTADGTIDGTGAILGDPDADYRRSDGMILDGPEYFSIFNGETGAFITSHDYIPPRGNVGDWGDTYGNRVDRFLACIAYLDGKRPSLVFCRGYYTRIVIAAFDYRYERLTTRWVFDTNDAGNESYAGQGNHSLSVGDVDNDGKDEIQYGSMALDDDGTGLYNTGMKHGDAAHLGDFDPTREGLEYWMAHEHANPNNNIPAMDYRDPKTGEVLWEIPGGGDFGRGSTADIHPDYIGAECWGSDGTGVYSSKGELISTSLPKTAGNGPNYNMFAWYDGDLLRELVDRTVINKYDAKTGGTNRVLTAYSYDNLSLSSNNSTKSTPCLIADMLGDWREEIIWRKSDNTALVIMSTPNYTDHRIYTLMHDPLYRTSIAWQNVGYNQPAHTGFYLGVGMDTPPTPDIYMASESTIPLNIDYDEDGVINDKDQCPNTTVGTDVNNIGCDYIEESSISIYSETPSCPNKSDGKIIIATNLENFIYNISIIGDAMDQSFLDVSLSPEENWVLEDLTDGFYEITIAIESINYEQTFGVLINEISEISGKRNISISNKAVTYSVSGSQEYYVTVNGISKTYITNTTALTDIEIDHLLVNKTNTIKIETDKDCQGIIEDNFNIDSLIKLYPNPTTGIIQINGANKGIVQVYNITGNLLFEKSVNNQTIIDLKGYVPGLYLVKVINKVSVETFKVILK